jgi:hypothetical protein
MKLQEVNEQYVNAHCKEILVANIKVLPQHFADKIEITIESE